jgi:hypothetical protein
MLRYRLLVSVIPLALVGGMASDWFAPAAQPCIPAGLAVFQMTSTPWRAQRRVAFTDNPAQATVRVQIVDRPELADFAVADDARALEADGCGMSDAMRLISITSAANADEPVIYLSREDDADYRIYVASRSFTAREAAALIVGARGGQARLAASTL